MIVQQGDGRQALVTDTWTTTDGRTHEIDVFYEHRLGGSAPVVSFPWVGRLHVLSAGLHAEAARRRAPFSIFTRASAARSDGDIANAQGAITLQDRPTALRFSTSTALWTQYVRTITPATPTNIRSGSRGRRRRPTSRR